MQLLQERLPVDEGLEVSLHLVELLDQSGHAIGGLVDDRGEDEVRPGEQVHPSQLPALTRQ